MEKQNRFFVIFISIVTYAILHSGEALKCYTCNSMEDKNCASGPFEEKNVLECVSHTTTSTETTPSVTTPTQTSPTETTPTQTSPTGTTPTQTSPTQTSPTQTTELKSALNTLNKKLTNNAIVPDHYRSRRSIFNVQRDAQEEKKEEWNCAVIERRLPNDTVIVKRGCVPFSDKCSNNTEKEKCELCNSDGCNNANTISINMVTLSWLMLSWTTVYIVTESYQLLSFTS